MISLEWDIKLKAANEQTRKQTKTHKHRQCMVVTRGKVSGDSKG